MNTTPRMQGIVKNWLTGFGFLLGQDGEIYFCHRRELQQNRRLLIADDLVEFSAVPGVLRPEARDVFVIEN